jgi:hypothetical protein
METGVTSAPNAEERCEMPKAKEIEHVTVSDVFSQAEGDGTREYLADYLKPFAKPITRDGASEGSGFAIGNTLCLKCGSGLDGMLGAFQWGLCHGEGVCSKCGWPARLYHYLKLPDGTEDRIVMMLQYHPDGVTKRNKDGSEVSGKDLLSSSD